MSDDRHHLKSLLMRESLVDKGVIQSTEGAFVRMLPDVHVLKLGGSSVMDRGRAVLFPLVSVIERLLSRNRLILATGGGARSRHVFSIGLDLGLPTGVLAEISGADSLGNAHILGTLLAPLGVVAIPPEMFGHLLPLFITAAPGVIFAGVPPYKLWEHPPKIGRIPPHRTDAGCFLVAEGFGCKSLTLVKDVKGLYAEDPKKNPSAEFIPEIDTKGIRERGIKTLPFDEVLLDLLDTARLIDQFQVIDGNQPELLERAVAGEHVGTIVRRGC